MDAKLGDRLARRTRTVAATRNREVGTWSPSVGKILGRLATLASVLAAILVLAQLVQHPGPSLSNWVLLAPYALYEGFIAVFGMFQKKATMFAANANELFVPLIGTWLFPFSVLYLGGNVTDGYAFVPVYAWLALSALYLGKNFSVLPEARTLVESGPYRAIRHPLYLGYCALWILWAIGRGNPAAYALMIIGIGLYEWRARMEEQKLLSMLPEYRSYIASTWRIIPGFGKSPEEEKILNSQ